MSTLNFYIISVLILSTNIALAQNSNFKPNFLPNVSSLTALRDLLETPDNTLEPSQPPAESSAVNSEPNPQSAGFYEVPSKASINISANSIGLSSSFFQPNALAYLGDKVVPNISKQENGYEIILEQLISVAGLFLENPHSQLVFNRMFDWKKFELENPLSKIDEMLSPSQVLSAIMGNVSFCKAVAVVCGLIADVAIFYSAIMLFTVVQKEFESGLCQKCE